MNGFERVVLFTDFGAAGPYVGQVELAYQAAGGRCPMVHLMHDAPVCNPQAAGVLLAALNGYIPEGSLVVAVVDPGVGTGRRVLFATVDGRGFLGPDNGLFAEVLRNGGLVRVFEVVWSPHVLSASFHGRDLFAPVAASLTNGSPAEMRELHPESLVGWEEPFRQDQVIYIDAYGNGWTGLRESDLTSDSELIVGGERLKRRRVFGEAGPGDAFWYVNSVGLIEIAVNQGRAADRLGLRLGTPVGVAPTTRSVRR